MTTLTKFQANRIDVLLVTVSGIAVACVSINVVRSAVVHVIAVYVC